MSTDPSFPTSTAADPLADLPVIVTGGASGLGAAVAARLASAGAAVTSLDRRPPSSGIQGVEVDLADGRATEDAETWERTVAVNLLGTAAVVRAAVPWLRQVRGRVVTVASTLGHRAVSDATAYCASKFGVVGFTRALTAELRGEVGVTMLTPGGMATAFFDEREDRYKPPADLELCDPVQVAESVHFALTRPPGCEIRELVVTPPG